MKTFALTISILLNIFLGLVLLYKGIDGCAEIADGKLGILSKEIKIGLFGTRDTLFTLPKGLTVRDVSATGADRFEPHRFRIVVTSEDSNMVDYSVKNEQIKAQYGELYSADVDRNR